MIRRHDAHLPWRWLVERADGTLAAGVAAESEQHLGTGCERCVAADRTVQRLRSAVAAGPLESPPAVADRRVLEMIRRLRAARDRAGTLVATLVLDRRADESPALRSSTGEARRLLWTMPGYEVDASLVSGAAGTDLLGQIVPEGDAPGAAVGGEVRLLRRGRVVARTKLASDGRFTFRSLPRGVVALEGAVDARAFVLPEFAVE